MWTGGRKRRRREAVVRGGAERCSFCHCAHHWNPGSVCFMVFEVTPLHTHTNTHTERERERVLSDVLVLKLLICCHYWWQDQTRWISSSEMPPEAPSL